MRTQSFRLTRSGARNIATTAKLRMGKPATGGITRAIILRLATFPDHVHVGLSEAVQESSPMDLWYIMSQVEQTM